MYLTAQRVRSPRGATGINVALYEHQGTDLPPNAWSLDAAALLNLVMTQHPGARKAVRVDVTPGGNSVDGFLDVVAPDGTPLGAIERAFDALRPGAMTERRAHLRKEDVVVEFSVNLGAIDIGAAFDALRAAALALYTHPDPPEWQKLAPIRIDASHDADGWHFALDAGSASRVRGAGGEAARVHLRDEVSLELRTKYGRLYPWVVQWVTNLSPEKVLDLGGAHIVAVSDGRVVHEWPTRPKAH